MLFVFFVGSDKEFLSSNIQLVDTISCVQNINVQCWIENGLHLFFFFTQFFNICFDHSCCFLLIIVNWVYYTMGVQQVAWPSCTIWLSNVILMKIDQLHTVADWCVYISSYSISRNFRWKVFSRIWLRQTFSEFLSSRLSKGSCKLAYNVE